MNALRTAAGAILLLMSAAAGAQSVTDAQCLLLSNAFAKDAKDPNAQKAAEIAGYFYLGRVGEHATAAQLKTLLEQAAKSITDANAGPPMTACVKAIQDKVQLVQSLGPSSPAPAAQPTKPPANPKGR